MKTPKTPKEYQIMLYVPKEFRPDYSQTGIQTFQFGFVQLTQDEKVRNCSAGYQNWDLNRWDDLSFRAQTDGGKAIPYGEELAYRSPYSVGLHRAEAMLKMLKKADSLKFPVQPTTYGQYIQLVCAGLGVDGAVSEGKPTGSGWGYDSTSHVTWKVTDIQWLVDQKIAEFMEKHSAAMVTARGY